MSKKSKFKTSFFLLSVVVVVVLAFIVSGNIFNSQAAIPEDRLLAVERGDLALSVVATGSIVPVSTVELKSKSSGLVERNLVDEGEIVQVGQVLIELDKELLRAQLREVEANLLAAEARKQEAVSNRASAVSLKQKLKMDLKNLDNNVVFLEKQVRRYENLFAEKLIPHAELEERERQFQEATFARDALRSELIMQDSRIEAAAKAITRVEAEVVQAQATRDRAAENLRYATIRSPLRAKVLKRHIEVGDAVSSILQLGSQATLLLTLGDMNQVFFEGRVDETDIGRVFVGQPARVKVDAFRERPFEGRVIRIAPLGEEEDNVIGFEVRVSIEDPDQILLAQMTANAEIIVEEKEDILLIPENAIIYDRERNTFAEVFDSEAEGQVRRIPIEIGISNGTTTEVLSGLTEEDRVVRSDTGGII